MRLMASASLILCAAAALAPRAADALVIQIGGSVSSVTASDTEQADLSTVPDAGSITSSGVGASAGNSAETTYWLSTSGFSASFELVAATDIATSTDGQAGSVFSLDPFTVDRDVQYSAMQIFGVNLVLQGDSATCGMSLVDATHGAVLFATTADSSTGSLTGTLHPGIAYAFVASAWVETGLDGVGRLTSSGDFELSFVPEPGLLWLACSAVAALALPRLTCRLGFG